MTAPQHNLALAFTQSMALVDKKAWDALAQPQPSPFLEWDWLELLERSGSAAPENGWLPFHMTVSRGDDMIAAAPMYVKGCSDGEFVFDHVWAEAASRLGLRYFPKLTAMSPFTPATGYRILFDANVSGLDEAAAARITLEAVDRLAAKTGLSGAHFLFLDSGLRTVLEDMGLSIWTHQSYVWKNEGFETFDDYLAGLNANRRKTIRRERRALAEAGVTIRLHAGNDIPDRLFPCMHRLYEKTNDKFGRWGCRFLTPAFFTGLADRLKHRLAFVAAYLPGREDPVGMSMLVHKDGRLYGRYWGADRHVEYLHFELCYYSPIAWAVAENMTLFDPGMGGEHKARRGFSSVPAHSAHHFYSESLNCLFKQHIPEINALEREHIEELNTLSPLKKQPGTRP